MSQASAREDVIAQDRPRPAPPGLRPGAVPHDGRIQQLRHQLLDHLDPDRRGHPVRLRPRLAGTGGQPASAGRSSPSSPCDRGPMAEVASAYPTAGGLYYWASKMKAGTGAGGPPGSTSVGQFAIVAGINFAAAFFINATIIGPLLGGAFTRQHAHLRGPESGRFRLGAPWASCIAIELIFNVAGHRIVAFMNTCQRVVAHRLRHRHHHRPVRAGNAADHGRCGLPCSPSQPQDTLRIWDDTIPGRTTRDHPVRHRAGAVLALLACCSRMDLHRL